MTSTKAGVTPPVAKLRALRAAVLEYLSELDNPAPDYGYRAVLRDRLRKIVGAPPASAPRTRR